MKEILQGLKFFGIFIIAIFAVQLSKANDASDVTFTKALKDKRIKIVSVTSNGGAITKGLSITIENTSKQEIDITMDPALMFKSENEDFQDLIAVGEESFSIKPKSKSTFKLQTFSANAMAKTPQKGLKYKFVGKGDESISKASAYIKKEKLFNRLGQLGIWTFTNKHCLNTIYVPGFNEDRTISFVKYLANVSGQQMPDYFTYHAFPEKVNKPGEIIFNQNVSSLHTYIEWNVGERHRNVRVKILDKNKMFYKNVRNNIVGRSNGIERMYVTFNPEEDLPGDYFIQVIDDDNYLWAEKKINFWVYNCTRK